MNDTFELYYDTGGHGGPYKSLTDARNAAEALLAGCHSMSIIEIRNRNSTYNGGYRPYHPVYSAYSCDSTYCVKENNSVLFHGN